MLNLEPEAYLASARFIAYKAASLHANYAARLDRTFFERMHFMEMEIDVGMPLKRSMDKSDSNRTFALDPSFELMRHEVFFAPNARPVNSKFRPAVYCPETMPTPSPAA